MWSRNVHGRRDASPRYCSRARRLTACRSRSPAASRQLAVHRRFIGWLLFNLAFSRLLHGAIFAHSIGIVAVDERAMFPRVRDVIGHSRQPFQRDASELPRGVIDRESKARIDTLIEEVPCLDFDLQAAGACGRLRAQLEAKETPIEPHDMQIAAHAFSLGLRLVTAKWLIRNVLARTRSQPKAKRPRGPHGPPGSVTSPDDAAQRTQKAKRRHGGPG